MNSMITNGILFDYTGLTRINGLPKWARDEQLYNCESAIRRVFKKKNNQKKNRA